MKRVLVGTQSGPMFVGSPSEQAYDQRGGLCVGGKDDVVVTTSPYKPAYLEYWEGLGFDLPTLVVAGPYQQDATLTNLLAQKPKVCAQIATALSGASARIEPFWVEPVDAILTDLLGQPLYVNVGLSVELSSKIAFKELCERIGLPTLPWVSSNTVDGLLVQIAESSFADQPFVIKSARGVGGVELGSMLRFRSLAEAHEKKTQFTA